MKRRTKKHANSAKKADVSKTSSIGIKEVSRNICKHCGGLMKSTAEGTSCLMCGRSAEHVCDACLYREEVAA